jgi:hypothetical protein
MDETPAQRTVRLVQCADRRIAEIRDGYEHAKKTPQQHRAQEAEDHASLLADTEANGASAEALAALQKDLNKLAAIMANTSSSPDGAGEDKIIQWTFQHSALGQIHITSEASRHWRFATVRDAGDIVLFSENYGRTNEFGELDDIDEIPDEEFEDCTEKVAIVVTQSGKILQSGFAGHTGIFEDVWVVPGVILQGVKDESPPGRFFSGRSIKALPSSSSWSPAPEGKVWYDHPFLNNGSQYFTDFEYFFVKRNIDLGACENDVLNGRGVYKMWQGSMHGAMQYWCPVKRKFMTEGEMLRQEHWFHNGDGSAQQRYFYSQNEMLDKYGGSASLPRSFDASISLPGSFDSSIPTAASSINDEPIITQVRSVNQAIDHKFKEAEQQGKVVNLS